MSIQLFLQKLDKDKIQYLTGEPMSRHTSFRIGGAAEIFVTPQTISELKTVIRSAKEEGVPYFVLGNGTNILVSDNGINGAVICLSKMCVIRKTDDSTLFAAAGTKLAALCTAAKDEMLGGLEFAYGIPGSVGGAVFMNAGAYGGEMKNVVEKVEYLGDNGEILTADREKLDFGYRKSAFSANGAVVTGAYFKLSGKAKDIISEEMKQIMQRRTDKQPLEYPSAGSVFKRPEGFFAGALIEESGLKGFSVGGAQVSEKHAGFIINKGNATAKDVKQLVEHIKKTVREKHGVNLECEIRFIGE